MPLEVFTRRNGVADFIRLKLIVIFEKAKNPFLSHIGGRGLRVTHALHLSPYSLSGSSFDSLTSYSLNFSRYLLRLKRYKWKSVEVGVFERDGLL